MLNWQWIALVGWKKILESSKFPNRKSDTPRAALVIFIATSGLSVTLQGKLPLQKQ